MQRGVVGASNLNLILQEALNPGGIGLKRGGVMYRFRDKVMQIRNNYDKEVFNGDIGVISSVDVEDRSLTVDFDGRNVEYGISELDELVLAYATTIHKAQGSEYPIVVMPVLMNHFVMLQRNLIYTGITRAKKILVIVGTRKALAYAVRNVTVTKRNTLLKERLKSSLPKAVLPAATAENAHLEEASSPKAGNRQTILPYSKRQQQTGKSRIPREMPSDLPYPQQSGQRVAEPAASYGQSSNDQKMTHEEWLKIDLFARLAKSPFRSRFHLSEKDKAYVRQKGMDTIRSHAQDFISRRLAPAVIPNDGRQTPMHGHPVFIAQHATGCCCRGCLYKWHGIPAGRELTEKEQKYVVDVLMQWIEKQMAAS